MTSRAYKPPHGGRVPPSIHNPHRPMLPPVDPSPAPLPARYGGNLETDEDLIAEAELVLAQWPASYQWNMVDALNYVRNRRG